MLDWVLNTPLQVSLLGTYLSRTTAILEQHFYDSVMGRSVFPEGDQRIFGKNEKNS